MVVVEAVDSKGDIVASFRTPSLYLVDIDNKTFYGFKMDVLTTGPLTFNVYNETRIDGTYALPYLAMFDVSIRNCDAPTTVTPEQELACEGGEIVLIADYTNSYELMNKSETGASFA